MKPIAAHVTYLKTIMLFTGVALLFAIVGQTATISASFAHNFSAVQVIRADHEEHQRAGILENVVAWADRAIDWSPSDSNWAVRRLLGYIYLHNQQVQNAAESLDVNDPHCPDSITCYRRGQVLYAQGRFDEATALWRRISSMDIYFAFQGDSAYKQGNIDDALEFYEISWHIADTPASAKSMMLLNLCRKHRGAQEMKQAVYWCEQAVLSRRDIWTQVELGRTYYEAGQYELAEHVLHELVSGHPDFAPAYQWLGLSWRKVGRKQEGLEALETSVRLAPQNVWARLDLANI